MSKIFRPSSIPTGLDGILSSIERKLRQIWPAPLRLWRGATAELPTASDYLGGIVYDSTADTLKIARSTGWSDFSLSTHAHAASAITFAPAGSVAATNVQAAIVELDTEKAALVHTHVIADVTGLQAALDGKLALSGGTLTGALFGTAATFSGALSAASGTFSGASAVTSGNLTIGAGSLIISSDGTKGGARIEQATGQPGIISIYSPSAVRSGYLGWSSGNRMQFVAEAGNTGVDIRGQTSGDVRLMTGSTVRVNVTTAGADVVGLLQCDTFRIDATATAAAVAQTHHVPISINGTVYKLLLAS